MTTLLLIYKCHITLESEAKTFLVGKHANFLAGAKKYCYYTGALPRKA